MNFYKAEGRPPYSASVIRYRPCIYIIHHSKRTGYLSLLNKIQHGGVDVLKVLETLY